jgi:hypothetical protein
VAQQFAFPPPPGADWTRLPPVVDPLVPDIALPLSPPPAAIAPGPATASSPSSGSGSEGIGFADPLDDSLRAWTLSEYDTETDPHSWFLPSHWLDATAWDGGIEVGLNGTDGNSEAFTLRTGGNLKRKTKIYEIGGDVTYLKTKTDGVEKQHRLLANSKYERFLGESRWSFYIKSFLEYDEFTAFDVRLLGNTGLGYLIVRSEHMRLKARFGGGASREFGGPDDNIKPEAAFGCDYDWELTDRQKVNVVTDYYPQWNNFEDYLLVTALNWECLIDQLANLSLKLSVSDRYDSTPYGRRPNDVDYGLLLLWKI